MQKDTAVNVPSVLTITSAAVLFISSSFLYPEKASGEVISSIAAVVNEDIITTLDVKKELAAVMQEAAQKKAPIADSDHEKIEQESLTKLIDKKLVEQKIRELNIKVSEEDLRQAIEEVKKQNNLTQDALVAALASQGLSYEQYRTQLKDQLERLRLVSQEVRAKIQVGEREMLEFFEANKVSFQEEEQLRARQIFFRMEKSSPAAEIKTTMMTALSVLNQARRGADFSELAKKYSNDASAADGGNLGVFRLNDTLSDFQEALSGMKPGEVSELIVTPVGLHIVKLEERIPGKIKQFAEVKADIEDRLYRKKSEERFAAWVSDLKAHANIEIK